MSLRYHSQYHAFARNHLKQRLNAFEKKTHRKPFFHPKQYRITDLYGSSEFRELLKRV